MLIKKDIPSAICETKEEDHTLELLCVDICLDESNVRLFTAYTPGTEGSEEDAATMCRMTDAIESLMNTIHPVVIAADFNCRHVDWANYKCPATCHPKEKVLLEFCLSNDLQQMVPGPTRPASGSLIDLVM